jgi:hypothetical protein
MVVACHIVLNLGRRGCNFMLSMLQYILQLALMRNGAKLSQRDQKLLSDFPVDARSPTELFRLDGKSIIYAVCPNPQCHHTYKLIFEDNSPIPSIQPPAVTNSTAMAVVVESNFFGLGQLVAPKFRF